MTFETRLAEAPYQNRSAIENEESAEKQWLLLSSRGNWYAIETTQVREVHTLPAFSSMPQVPDFIAGVVNIRGENLPVVDLAQRLGQNWRAPKTSDALIVLQTPRPFALWVDEVHDIANIKAAQIEAAPFANEYSFATDIAHWENQIVLVLQPLRLLEENGADSAHATNGSEVFLAVDDKEQAIFRARAQRLSQTVDDDFSRKHDSTDENATAIARIEMGGEERGVILSQVREFCALENFTTVPCCPSHIIGQMNLRGEIVTLLDISTRVGLRAFSTQGAASTSSKSISSKSAKTVVVLKMSAETGDDDGLVGVLVDGVLDVLHTPQNAMFAAESRPNAALENQADYHSMILHENKALYILDLASLVAEKHWVVDEKI